MAERITRRGLKRNVKNKTKVFFEDREGTLIQDRDDIYFSPLKGKKRKKLRADKYIDLMVPYPSTGPQAGTFYRRIYQIDL